MKRNIILLVVVLLTTVIVNAQSVIKGKVVDDANKALEYANIALFAKDSLVTGGITNKKGEFLLQAKKRDYTLVVSFVGYKTVKKALKQEELPYSNLSIVLETDSELLDEVKVKSSSLKQDFHKKVLTVTRSMAQKAVVSEDLFKEIPLVKVNKQSNTLEVEGKSALLLINGRRIESDNPLLSLPEPNKIKRIEVISSPSVKYANESIQKIVNVILKENNEGYEGSFKADIPIPIKDNASSFSYARLGYWYKKLHLFTNYNYVGVHKYIEEATKREGKNSLYTSNPNPKNRYIFNKHSILGGVDYFFSEKSSANITARYQTNKLRLRESSVIQELQNGVLQSDYMMVSNTKYPKFNEYNLSGYYKYIFGKQKQELVVEANYFNFKNEQNIKYNEVDNLSSSSNSWENFTSDTRESEKISLSYTLPLSEKSKFETGLSYYRQDMDNNFQSARIRNNLKYEENRIVTYASWQHNFQRLSIRLGINYEKAEIKVNKNIKNEYPSLFPQIDLKYMLNEENMVGLMLNRKIARPIRSQLNPFVYREDAYTIQTGNPQLKPSYADVLSLTHNYNGAFYCLLSINAGYCDDYIAATKYTNAQGQLVNSYSNIVDMKSVGFSLEPEFEFLDGSLIVTPYVDVEYLDFSGSDDNLTYDNSGWHTNYGGSLEWDFGAFAFSYDCTFSNYNILLQGKRRVGSTSYVELSKNLFKNRARLALGYAWKMQKNKAIYDTETIYQVNEVKMPSTLSLSFTYSFNKNKGKKGRKVRMETEKGEKY